MCWSSKFSENVGTLSTVYCVETLGFSVIYRLRMLAQPTLFFLVLYVSRSATTGSLLTSWDLPVFPAEDCIVDNVAISDSSIPRRLWIAFKTVPDPLPHHLSRLLSRNNRSSGGWDINLCDNQCQRALMNKVYRNTSTLWAFKKIHYMVGNSAADIWRYAILYIFGGVYFDDDSYIETRLDDVIKKDDRLILSKENNYYKDDCYKPSYNLSEVYLSRLYDKQAASLQQDKKNISTTSVVQSLFDGRTLVSWGVFAAPRHPIIKRTLSNIVQLVKLEYLRQSALQALRWEARWKVCMCVTGPSVLTASAKQVLLESIDRGGKLQYRIVNRDFVEYGGEFKAYRDKDPAHYMSTMQKYKIPLLSDYAPVNKSKSLLGNKIWTKGGERQVAAVAGPPWGGARTGSGATRPLKHFSETGGGKKRQKKNLWFSNL